jgi:S1-C subfamily serine protease
MYESDRSNRSISSGLAWLPWCLVGAALFYIWQQPTTQNQNREATGPLLLRTAGTPTTAPRSVPIQWESGTVDRRAARHEMLKPQFEETAARRQYPSSRQIAPRRQLTPEEVSNIESFRRHSSSVVFIKTAGVAINPFTLDRRRVQTGSGSGFVWDRNGHIVTNFHVVLSSKSRPHIAESLTVFLADQSSWKAKVVGYAPDKDLAVLKIDAPTELLTPLPLGTSSDLLVGQKVLAIGSPFGFDQTLTTGIISGLERVIESVTQREIDGVIQTDAAINPGNSGGPLIDSSGRLIGVNTAIFSPSGAYAGIGFAIPVDTVSRYIPELIENGKVVRPWLGVSLAPAELTRQHGIEGVLVIKTQPNGTAVQAGIRPTRYEDEQIVLGDIIVAMNGDKISDSDDLLDFLDKHEVGDRVTITVLRDITTDSPRQVQLQAVLKSQSEAG